MWIAVEHDDIGRCDQCVHDQFDERAGKYDHRAYICDGAYHVTCEGASWDNHIIGRTCEIEACDCPKIIRLLLYAIEREAAAGIFEVDNWALTFPKKTKRMVAICREVAAAALADKLPDVLSEIVVAYLW